MELISPKTNAVFAKYLDLLTYCVKVKSTEESIIDLYLAIVIFFCCMELK